MHRFELTETSLDIEIVGLDRLWALRSSVSLPRAAIRTVRRRTPQDTPPLWRIGTHVPGVIVAGTYFGSGRREFWATRLGDDAVVIELEGARLTRVVVDLADSQRLLDACAR